MINITWPISWMNLKNTVKNLLKNDIKKPVAKDHVLHDSIYMNVQNRQICGEKKQINGFLGLGETGGNEE